MVNMRMSQQNEVDFSGRTGNLFIFIDISPLLHTEINEKLFSACLNVRTAACYFMRSTDKLYLHRIMLLSVMVIPRKDRAVLPYNSFYVR